MTLMRNMACGYKTSLLRSTKNSNIINQLLTVAQRQKHMKVLCVTEPNVGTVYRLRRHRDPS